MSVPVDFRGDRLDDIFQQPSLPDIDALDAIATKIREQAKEEVRAEVADKVKAASATMCTGATSTPTNSGARSCATAPVARSTITVVADQSSGGTSIRSPAGRVPEAVRDGAEHIEERREDREPTPADVMGKRRLPVAEDLRYASQPQGGSPPYPI